MAWYIISDIIQLTRSEYYVILSCNPVIATWAYTAVNLLKESIIKYQITTSSTPHGGLTTKAHLIKHGDLSKGIMSHMLVKYENIKQKLFSLIL